MGSKVTYAYSISGGSALQHAVCHMQYDQPFYRLLCFLLHLMSELTNSENLLLNVAVEQFLKLVSNQSDVNHKSPHECFFHSLFDSVSKRDTFIIDNYQCDGKRCEYSVQDLLAQNTKSKTNRVFFCVISRIWTLKLSQMTGMPSQSRCLLERTLMRLHETRQRTYLLSSVSYIGSLLCFWFICGSLTYTL